MKRYLEAWFRHPLLVSLPLLIALVLAPMYELHSARQYQSTASVWADAPIPGSSTISTGVSGESPATAQAAVLTELLQTHDFMLSVALGTPLARSLRHQSLIAVNRTLSQLPSTISVTTPGPQVINVVVKSKNAALAVALNRSLLHEYLAYVFGELDGRARAQLQYEQSQVAAANSALLAAQAQLAKYTSGTAAGGGSAAASGGTAAELTSEVLAAQQQLNTAQEGYSQAAANLRNEKAASSLSVTDAPSQPVPLSRKKRVIFAGVGGLLAGVVISLITLMAVTAGDTAPRRSDEIEQALGLRVVGTIDDRGRPSRIPLLRRSS